MALAGIELPTLVYEADPLKKPYKQLRINKINLFKLGTENRIVVRQRWRALHKMLTLVMI